MQLGLVTNNGETLKMTALVVPFICHPLTSQPISQSREHCGHLLGLELADSAVTTDALEIDVLIGSDSYWDLVTGKIKLSEGRMGRQPSTLELGGFFQVQLVDKKLQCISPSTQHTP